MRGNHPPGAAQVANVVQVANAQRLQQVLEVGAVLLADGTKRCLTGRCPFRFEIDGLVKD